MTSGSCTRTAGVLQLFLLLAASSTSMLGWVLITPVVPFVTRELAAWPGAVALLPAALAAPALMIGIASPLVGVVADQVGRVRLLIAAMVACTVFGTAQFYLDDLGVVIGCSVLVGVCQAAIITCCTTMVCDYWSGDRRNRYLGLQTTVAAVAAVALTVIARPPGAAGWSTPFWLYFLVLALVIPAARWLRAPLPSTGERARSEHVRWSRLVAPCCVTLIGGIVFYALIVELPNSLSGAGMRSVAVIESISAIMSFAIAAGGMMFARFARHGLRTLLSGELVMSAAGLVVVAGSGSVPVITVGCVLTGVATGLLLPTLLSRALDSLDFADRGRGTGLWTGTLFMGQFLAPLVIAGLGAVVGGPRPALTVLGIAVAILSVTLHFWPLSSDSASAQEDVPRRSEPR